MQQQLAPGKLGLTFQEDLTVLQLVAEANAG
jgi:hypothetical protein